MRPSGTWIFLLFTLLKSVTAGGSFKLRLISYYNRHGHDRAKGYCDVFVKSKTSKCDFKMTLSLDGRDGSRGPRWDDITSHIFHDQDSVRFPGYFGRESLNPIERRFSRWAGRLFVSMDIVDYDGLSDHDHVDTLAKTIVVGPDGKKRRHQVQGRIHGSNSQLDFDLTVQCDKHYFPPSCTSKCQPRNNHKGHYTCDSRGNKLCLKGWQNPQRNCLDVEDSCHKKSCRNGGWCVTTSIGTRCSCRPGFHGPQCEKKFTANRCRNRTCLNDGKCVETTGTASCLCNSPFFGEQCEQCHPDMKGGDACPVAMTPMPMNEAQFRTAEYKTAAAFVVPLLVLLIVVAFVVFRQRKRFQPYLPGFLKAKGSRSNDSFDNGYYASDRPSVADSEIAMVRDVANNMYDLEDPTPSECSQGDYGSLYGSLEEDNESIAEVEREKDLKGTLQPPALPPRDFMRGRIPDPSAVDIQVRDSTDV